MIPAGVLLYRDDTGRTQAEKLAQKVRALPRPPGARHLPRDVRHRQRLLLLPLRRRLRAHEGHPLRDPRSRVRGRTPKPRCTTRTASTRRTANPGRTSPASGPGGRAASPTAAPTSTRRPTAAAAEAAMAEARTVVITGASPRPRSGDRRPPPPSRVDGGRRRCDRPTPASNGCAALTGAPAGDRAAHRGVRSTSTTPRRSRPPRARSSTRSGPPTASCTTPVSPPSAASKSCPMTTWEQMFSTNFLGPVRLTRALLPAMRARRPRPDRRWCRAMGAIRGMPADRRVLGHQGRARAMGRVALLQEIAPFGLGVTVLVAGSFKTDILELTQTYADPDGPYGRAAPQPRDLRAPLPALRRLARAVRPRGRASARRATAVRRHSVGLDARLLLVGNRLMPTGAAPAHHRPARSASPGPVRFVAIGRQQDAVRNDAAKGRSH